ncbi:MAG: molecular chaperone HtpG [Myxococcota bacterium]
MTVETRAFQAHTRKLLDLMIHSIYSHKEIFLRELLSNASDAIDKVRFEALTNPELATTEHRIKLVPDADNRTLTIIDNGIGMSHDEVVEHIGTIAKSGSEAYAEKLRTASTDTAIPELIGQFGVGFYSAFMVARKVLLETQKTGEPEAIRWESTGDGQYTIERLPPRERGTTITLFLRPTKEHGDDEDDATDDIATAGDDARNDQDYADPWILRQIVKKYSDFIAFPIVMDRERIEVERDDDGKVIEGGTPKKTVETDTLNSMKALWTRPASGIERTEYDEFYKHVTHDWTDPSEVIHLHVEGTQEYTALLYIPSKAPFDLYSREQRRGLQLYIKRVFISEEVKELIPEYLRFVKGLVDSSDLPLNMSREVIQQDRLVAVIRKHLTNKVISYLKDLQAKDRPRYETLWTEFGPALKEGFHYDPTVKDKLADLVLVASTHGPGLFTLKEVAERAKEGQKALYYLTGDNREILGQAPQLEVFRKRGVEVILLGDPIDEIMVGTLDKFADKPLKSAARGELDDLPEAQGDDAKPQEEAGDLTLLTTKLKDLLKDDVSDVRVSNRLTDSAVCLVSDEQALSPHLARLMQSMGQSVPAQKRLMEINATHPAIRGLQDLAGREGSEEKLKDYAEMLLDQALLAEGAPLKNPAQFARRVADAMAAAVAR